MNFVALYCEMYFLIVLMPNKYIIRKLLSYYQISGRETHLNLFFFPVQDFIMWTVQCKLCYCNAGISINLHWYFESVLNLYHKYCLKADYFELWHNFIHLCEPCMQLLPHQLAVLFWPGMTKYKEMLCVLFWFLRKIWKQILESSLLQTFMQLRVLLCRCDEYAVNSSKFDTPEYSNINTIKTYSFIEQFTFWYQHFFLKPISHLALHSNV